MAMDLYNNVLPVRAIQAQNITSSNIASGDIDLAGFEAADLVVDFGDIAEMGTSPEGAAKIDIHLEHAAADGTGSAGTYADVAVTDVVGAASVTGGIVATTTTDASLIHRGYRGGKRFIRVTLEPTGLTSGGPVVAIANLGHPRHAPVQ